MTVVIRAGEASLADWRKIWRGAALTVDPAHHAGVAASAASVERILARGEPVYGINIGFGKLAAMRIEPADLAQLQRNIVLSHAAGVGEPASVATTRLMMAAKARQPGPRRFGRAAADASAISRLCSPWADSSGTGARVGRRVGRSCAPCAYGGDDDRGR